MKGCAFMSATVQDKRVFAPIPAKHVYTVIIRPCTDTTGYYAICDMPNGGAVTQGETYWETKKNMYEAMSLYLEDCPEVLDYDLSFEFQNAQDTDY
jgi:predicted RNase H-like HicB family nuclease